MHDSICFTIFYFVWCFVKSSDGSVTNGSRTFFVILLTVEKVFIHFVPFSITVDFFSIKNCKDKCYCKCI